MVLLRSESFLGEGNFVCFNEAVLKVFTWHGYMKVQEYIVRNSDLRMLKEALSARHVRSAD